MGLSIGIDSEHDDNDFFGGKSELNELRALEICDSLPLVEAIIDKKLDPVVGEVIA